MHRVSASEHPSHQCSVEIGSRTALLAVPIALNYGYDYGTGGVTTAGMTNARVQYGYGYGTG